MKDTSSKCYFVAAVFYYTCSSYLTAQGTKEFLVKLRGVNLLGNFIIRINVVWPGPSRFPKEPSSNIRSAVDKKVIEYSITLTVQVSRLLPGVTSAASLSLSTCRDVHAEQCCGQAHNNIHLKLDLK